MRFKFGPSASPYLCISPATPVPLRCGRRVWEAGCSPASRTLSFRALLRPKKQGPHWALTSSLTSQTGVSAQPCTAWHGRHQYIRGSLERALPFWRFGAPTPDDLGLVRIRPDTWIMNHGNLRWSPRGKRESWWFPASSQGKKKKCGCIIVGFLSFFSP